MMSRYDDIVTAIAAHRAKALRKAHPELSATAVAAKALRDARTLYAEAAKALPEPLPASAARRAASRFAAIPAPKKTGV